MKSTFLLDKLREISVSTINTRNLIIDGKVFLAKGQLDAIEDKINRLYNAIQDELLENSEYKLENDKTNSTE